MNEQWRDVPGYVGLYMLSNHGRVKSLPATRIYKHRSCGEIAFCRRGKVLTPIIASSGYVRYNLSVNRQINIMYAYTLVKRVFLPDEYDLADIAWLRPETTHSGSGEPRQVRCNETGQEFNSIRSAADALDLSYSYLCQCIRAGRDCHGYTFTKIESRR